MRFIYTILFYLVLPYLFLRLLWRSRRNPDYRHRWLERLGYCPHHMGQCIWVHAVSVGETIAATPFIKALKKSYPDLPIVVTNMTPTGAARVKAAFGNSVLQAYVPYDVPDAMSRFLDRVCPAVVIIMETELWPNLFAVCKKRNIPIMIANARLSEKSMRGYQWIASLTREMVDAVTILAAQASADAQRFIQLGISPEKVKITGNLKFDLEVPVDLAEKSIVLRKEIGNERLVWIAASTHAGEEDIILAAQQQIQKQIPQSLLVLVPRHPERFDSVAELVKQQGFHIARRSHNDIVSSDVNVYLADTMGELLLMYSIADVAFVAGSLVSVGGHNMLEPAILRKPILTGPHLFNFAEISEMLFSAKGMVKINNADELANAVLQLFNDAEYRKKMGENAYKVVEENKGSLTKQIQLALSLF